MLISMLRKIQIRNFKCLKDVNVRLGKITVFIGPNSSGKSSVIQALLILKQSVGETNVGLSYPYISLGTFDDIVYVGSRRKEITIGVEGISSLKKEIEPLWIRNVFFHYELSFDAKGMQSQRALIAEPGPGPISRRMHLSGGWARDRELEVKPKRIERNGAHIEFRGNDRIGYPIRIFGGGVSGENEKSQRIYESLRESFAEVVSTIGNTLNNLFVVPGIRGIDRPIVDLLDKPVKDFITIHGTSKQASNLASTLGYKPELADKVSQWTERLTGKKVRQRLAVGRRTSVEAMYPGLSSNIINEGLGLNQIIFAFSHLADAPSDSLIAIEEPEIHLHPKAQSELIDIFVEICKKENKQILLTTHSEHILFRLLTKVAKGELKPKDLSVYYFTKENTAASAKELKVDKKGGLEGGLPGFFEEEIKEFKDYLDALTKKD